MTTTTFKPDKSYRVESGIIPMDQACSSCSNHYAFAIRITGRIPANILESVINAFSIAQNEPVFSHSTQGPFVFVGDLTCAHTKREPQTPCPSTAEQMKTSDETYFPVLIPTHVLPYWADFSLEIDGQATPTKVDVQAEITKRQFHALMGDEATLIRHIALQTEGPDDWDIRVRLQDTLACENQQSMQEAIIWAILDQEPGPRRHSTQDIRRRARDWTDIRDEAALFLVQMYAHATSPEMMVPDEELSRMQQQGLTLEDFMRPE